MIRAFLIFLLLLGLPAKADRLRLVSTTTTENSGLMDALLPKLASATGIKVDLLVTGTGQAFRIGEQGDADVLLVHDPKGEQGFVDAGYGASRHPVMYNSFVVVGPKADPAALRDADSEKDAFARLAKAEAVFLSRGDDSGTHRAERRLWAEEPVGSWYRETGAGMGTTLNIAAAQSAYTLVDVGSWAAFANKGDLEVLYEDASALRNPYSVIPVSPLRHSHVNTQGAKQLVDWLLSEEGQNAIQSFEIDGKPVFCPMVALNQNEPYSECSISAH